ncbi:hypothetical protein CVT26_014412 [Gymnopilus dilepis]|uniref:NCA2-domain-containing protein n=1 Tax=Gymnopilus dilepis TaxID=231916 RepID=A0A409Y7G8_9AGAR|nr:hypothetical protein CVT26_014412 [Gymnopilus dilepis]
MPSEFVGHFTRSLELSASRPTSPSPREEQPDVQDYTAAAVIHRKQALHTLFVSLNKAVITVDDVQKALQALQDISHTKRQYVTGKLAEGRDFADSAPDYEEAALEAAIVGKLTVALYSDALETCLHQATSVETEAEWWGDIETSRFQVAFYFIETLPIRILNVARMIVDEARAQRVPLSISTFSPSSLRSLLRSSSRFTLQPGRFVMACFPHLQHQQSLSLAVLLTSPGFRHAVLETMSVALRNVLEAASLAARFLTLPLELTRQECKFKRKELERMRDKRAEMLGELAQLRTSLADLIGNTNSMKINSSAKQEYTSFLRTLVRLVSPSDAPASLSTATPASSPIEPLQELSLALPTLTHVHLQTIHEQQLLRPSVLTRMWPRLLIFPPLALYIYSSRTSWIPALIDMTKDAKETVKGFVQGWLVEPLLGVLHTVRAGGKGDILVSQEGVKSDLESLNRMTLDLARDALHLSPPQLAALSERVRMGDLTPVMEAYEEDIRTPLRSAIRGTLLRNVFIQVQKAKVDIDQALAGIDRLLKSQELTFAFVGVAPALAVVWAFTSGVYGLWSGGWEKGKYGGKRRRRGAWERIRRIERILILQPSKDSMNSQVSTTTSAPIPPLPTGLLILSLARLRSFAISCLPEEIQPPFLEDLADLEDTRLDRDAKLLVVQRMWRSWGQGERAVLRF